MIKVAMIGAGSVVFCKNLAGDILGYPEFRDATIALMDIDAERLEVAAAMTRKVADAIGARPKIEATLDRRSALQDADFVINMVQVGGFDSTLVDFEIPRKYGLRFTIADTTGPGGLFRALRTFPLLTGLCSDIQAVCPHAWLLNYSNPMSMNMQTVTRTSSVRAVGLCHSVQGTLNQLMGYLGEDPAKIAVVCAGINHMAFYLRLEKDGQDLYPRLFEAMNTRPDVYNSNRVRFELMRRLGHFVTESSEHNAEYSPFFMPHGAEQARKFSVPYDEYLRRCDCIVDEFERMKTFSRSAQPVEVRRSPEYGSTIIHSIVTGRPAVVYGNMPNRGTIANLPDSAIAEAPTLVDRTGLRFVTVGEIPPQLIGYMQPHVTQHELFIRAAMEGRRDHVCQAAMMDPLTAATMPPDRIVEMCDEMIAAHGFVSDGGFLPALDTKRSLVPTSGKTFPRVDAAALRASWCATATKKLGEFLPAWQVIGPIRYPIAGQSALRSANPVEAALLASKEGRIDFDARYDAGDGLRLSWKEATAGERGFVDLAAALGPAEWVAAYGYAEVRSVQPREAVLRVGSDDGIRIWVNGKEVHTMEIGRGYIPGADEVPVYLRAGVNRILVKVENRTGAWGFGVAVPAAHV